MKVYTHVVTDQLRHNKKFFGISTDEDGTGYQEAMDWINEYQECGGGKRFEYERYEYDLNFVWKQTCEGLQKILHDAQESGVFGAFHVGKIMVEFRCSNDGLDDVYHNCVCDMYLYGKYNPDLDWRVHDVPYDFISDYVPDMKVPKRRTVDGFKRACEKEFVKWLNQYPQYIQYALAETVVDEWY